MPSCHDTDSSGPPAAAQLPAELDPRDAPPLDRYCDLVLQGGVIDGLAYPSFLVELARRFHFHSVGGTSVGALAACLLAACEYRRRYGSLTGFNEGLRTLPEELAESVDGSTRLCSLFQAKPGLAPLLALGLDLIEALASDAPTREQQPVGALRRAWQIYARLRPALLRHFPPGACWGLAALLGGLAGLSLLLQRPALAAAALLLLMLGACLHSHLAPFLALARALRDWSRTRGQGLCTGMRSPGSAQSGLTEWLHEGLQKAADLPMSQPLCFKDLWAAPGGPTDPFSGDKSPRSIDVFTVSSCLSHGRSYILPSVDPSARLFFKLSEWKPFFPAEVLAHLARHAEPLNWAEDPLDGLFIRRQQLLSQRCRKARSPERLELRRQLRRLRRQRAQLAQEARRCVDGQRDLRELPAGQLPLVVAARLSLSVPFLLDALPLCAFDLENSPEDMALKPLWFSDGGIVSNFPIHAFDRALPRWPTFGVLVLDESLKVSARARRSASYVPYDPRQGSNDVFIDGAQQGGAAAGSLWPFVRALYRTLTDAEDRSHLRLPDVRTRVLRIYTQRAFSSSLNLRVAPEQMWQVAVNGMRGGRNLSQAYLGELPQGEPFQLWSDHRWVRLNLLVENLRRYLAGFGAALYDERMLPRSLMEQIEQACQQAPLSPPQDAKVWTAAQVAQLKASVQAIADLERALRQPALALPDRPEPSTTLKSKPRA